MKSDLNINSPWCEYPRPAFKRDSFFSLNGEWDFEISASEELPTRYSEKIIVPFPPESELSGINRRIKKGQHLYYKRQFTLPDDFKKSKVILHFGAVDQIAEVWLNGERLGKHEGGYLPFSFDITSSLRSDNEICVKVIDDLDLKFPYGKQRNRRGGMWYTPVSGIWQTVWIEALPKNNIEKIKITPSTKDVLIEITGGSKQKRLILNDYDEVYDFEEDSIRISPKEIKLWTPESPTLYYFTIKSGEDKIDSYFALREIGIQAVDGTPRITLNGEPYIFHGLLDQGYFTDGIFLPRSSKGYEDDIIAAKRLGFNMLRKHIKIEPPIFYYLCDKLGMAVFQDMVNNSGYSFIRDTALPTVGMKKISDKFLHPNKKSREIFLNHMRGTVEHLYNYPSILYYTIFNEGWGQFCADKAYDILKSYDGTRIIDATSGWFTQKKSDVDSHHIYFKKLRADIKDRPCVISEFGGYSHRVSGHLFGKNNYGYSTLQTKEEFAEAIKRLYLSEVLPLVERGVSALVYTQISDVEDETNGFLTYDREILKVDENEFLSISKKLYEATNSTKES